MEDNGKKKHLTEDETRAVAEAARESKWDKPSFLREIFLGNFRLDLVHPFPKALGIDRPEYQAFYANMKKFLEQEVDSDLIDREGKIPDKVIRRLAEMGAFGMKIPSEYGGLGFTQAEYNKIMQLVGSQDGNVTALLSAHQSIGVPQPLKLFGTEEQKKKYLPRMAKGEISAFALTEQEVGSDPANLHSNVVETDDGYILNGEKLWCTNGTIADIIIVMAHHKEDKAISAFIVEMKWPGVKVEHHCRFMGLKALENAVISFTNVRVPKENLLWHRGKGLKLALITLNTGRLTIPAICTGTAKGCVEVVRKWGKSRVQWGQPVGKHEAISQKIADMTAMTFAMESVSDIATAMSDQGYDIRLEAAVAKMFNTEAGWKIVDDTLQVRGGRGYETADSLRARGEQPIPIERAMRDFRINLIFEGSSEIMRLFIAREAVDKHLEVAWDLINPKSTAGQRMSAIPKILFFYGWWYPTRWLGYALWPRYSEFGELAKHARFINRATRKLSRQLFHGMLRFQAKLAYKQAFLFRAVDIGAELFAMSATISRAAKLANEGNRDATEIADLFCRNAERRVRSYFHALWSNDDVEKYQIAKNILNDKYTWLEDGITGFVSEDKGKAKTEKVAEKKEAALV
jgi:alkylation response protein AidB-like acyl-CoA dehydrogenase